MKFWSADRSQELERVTQACPVKGCKNSSHPVKTLYQSQTKEPAVIWNCGQHEIFSCKVQDWNPKPDLILRIS